MYDKQQRIIVRRGLFVGSKVDRLQYDKQQRISYADSIVGLSTMSPILDKQQRMSYA